jgi:putative transposase
MEVEFCISALEKALLISIPEIFNTDQGSQFTSKSFIDLLISKNIQISMDHKGRCFDNIFIERLWRTIKQELIYHKRLDNVRDLERALEEYIPWYNNERLHQGIDYKRPADLYFARREECQEAHQEAIRLAS